MSAAVVWEIDAAGGPGPRGGAAVCAHGGRFYVSGGIAGSMLRRSRLGSKQPDFGKDRALPGCMLRMDAWTSETWICRPREPGEEEEGEEEEEEEEAEPNPKRARGGRAAARPALRRSATPDASPGSKRKRRQETPPPRRVQFSEPTALGWKWERLLADRPEHPAAAFHAAAVHSPGGGGGDVLLLHGGIRASLRNGEKLKERADRGSLPRGSRDLTAVDLRTGAVRTVDPAAGVAPALHGHSAEVLSNRDSLVVCGGMHGRAHAFTPNASVHIFDLSLRIWRSCEVPTPLPVNFLGGLRYAGPGQIAGCGGMECITVGRASTRWWQMPLDGWPGSSDARPTDVGGWMLRFAEHKLSVRWHRTHPLPGAGPLQHSLGWVATLDDGVTCCVQRSAAAPSTAIDRETVPRGLASNLWVAGGSLEEGYGRCVLADAEGERPLPLSVHAASDGRLAVLCHGVRCGVSGLHVHLGTVSHAELEETGPEGYTDPWRDDGDDLTPPPVEASARLRRPRSMPQAEPPADDEQSASVDAEAPPDGAQREQADAEEPAVAAEDTLVNFGGDDGMFAAKEEPTDSFGREAPTGDGGDDGDDFEEMPF